MADDNIQHGIDDDPNNDPHKAKVGGAIGGAITGAVAGSAVGPLGTVGGAIVGGVAAAFASEAAVREVDKHDNDNTVTGIGDGVTHGHVSALHDAGVATGEAYDSAKNRTTTDPAYSETTPGMVGNGVSGVQTGGVAIEGTPDTRGMTEKLADNVTGDHTDDKTGKSV